MEPNMVRLGVSPAMSTGLALEEAGQRGSLCVITRTEMEDMRSYSLLDVVMTI